MTDEGQRTADPSPRDTAAVVKLVDAAVVLITSFAIAFLVLWAASILRGRPMFQELPDWLNTMVSSVWTQLTGAAGALGFVVRCLLAPGGRRNYLVSCGITSAVIVVAIVGVAAVLPAPLPPPLATLDLWFNVAFEPPSSDPLNLDFVHTRPEGRLPITLAPQAGGDYLTTIKMPQGSGEQYLGFFHRLIQHSTRRDLPPNTVVCVERTEARPAQLRELFLSCQESKSCGLKAGRDQGWVRPCAVTPQASSWLAVAHAQTPAKPGWVVPTLETLKASGGRQGLGYTIFQLETGPLPTLQAADGFIYRIRGNGQPIYVGGWKPELLRTPFDAARGLTLAFGLENLDFSGARAGTEEIEVTIEFLAQDRALRALRLPLDYVALRDAGPAEVKADDVKVRWRATYARPEHEHKFEIFLSTDPITSAAAAEAQKKRLDTGGVRLDDQPMVGVIRPPLPPNRSFGIVLGLEQPSGQIRFTFDETTANRLCREVVARHQGIVSPHAYRYEMEPRRSGTAPTRPCRSL